MAARQVRWPGAWALWMGTLAVAVQLSGAEKVALTMKTTGEVRHQPVGAEAFETLRRGIALFDGEVVVTGEDGLAIALFLDDKSQLKIKKNSEVEISGSRQEGTISKRIGMAYGSMKATVEEQTRDFVITTPTSVASIKGTEFWLISDPALGDLLIGITGSVELTNVISGAVHTVEPGTVVESTQGGEINVLVTVKIRGEASSEVSGGQFTMTNITVLQGDVAPQDLSGTVDVTGTTVFEGADVTVGSVITLTGILDQQTGNVAATVVEVSAPITVTAVVSGPLTGNRFTISDVTLVAGESETLPAAVAVTELTVIEGGDIVLGAQVTITGNYNEETEVLEAARIDVVIPQLKITGMISSIVSDREIQVEGIRLLAGQADLSRFSGKIIVTESTVIEGGELAVGASITVTGTLDETTGDVVADHIEVSQVVLTATVNSPVTNNEFEITDVTVLEGDLDPDALSGIVRLTPDTEVEGGDIVVGVQVSVTGNVDPATGAFVASKIVVILVEKELIVDMEDNQGRKRELVIRFQ
ncbi:MAG: FecR domain-containing protein [Fidelibacterota bacterium]